MKIKNKKVAGGIAGVIAATLMAGSFVFQSEGMLYKAYQDAVGVWTICAGHTRGVQPGDVATPEQCGKYASQDILIAQKAVDRCIRVPMSVGQYAAFTDAAYNIGPSVMCGSTLQRLANSGHMKAACRQLPRWKYAGGRVLPGLITRRALEQAACLTEYGLLTSVLSLLPEES